MVALLALFVVLLLVLLVAVGLAVAFLVPALRRDSRFEMDRRFPGLRGAWAVTERARVAAVVAVCGIAGSGLLLAEHRNGLPLILAPALAGLCAVLLLGLGQRLVGRRLAGPAAALETRRIVDYAPKPLSAAVGVAAALVGAGLAAAVLLSDADGRSYSVSCPTGTSSHSFLGTYYAWPLATLVGLLLVTGAAALRLVAARPRNGAEPGIVLADDETRRRAATAIVAGVGLGLAGTLLPLALTDQSVVAGLRWAAEQGGCGLALSVWVDRGLGVVAVLALLLGVWCAARLLVPGSRRPVPVAREQAGA